jgi:hypothetical protein
MVSLVAQRYAPCTQVTPHGIPHRTHPCHHRDPVRHRRRPVRAVRAYLAEARLDHLGDLLDTGQLVVSELATNALLHTASHKITLRLRIDGDRLLITVDDAGGTPHRPGLRDLPVNHGRGTRPRRPPLRRDRLAAACPGAARCGRP